jgi:amino acid adenylation domain-containing protein
VSVHTGAAGLTIRSMLESQAAQRPNAPALLAPDRETMTYAQLLAQVNRSRAALHSAGVCRGDRIAVVLSNGPVMASAFLSIADVAACAPLNPAYRESEYSFYLSDLAPKAIVVERGVESPALAAAKHLNIPVIRLCPCLDGPAGSFWLEHDSPPTEGTPAGLVQPSPSRPEDIALVLHTSGTTSRPKQVPLTHANLCCSAAHIRHALELTAADRCLNVMPLFHIHGLAAAVLASLAAGGSLICTPGFYAPRFLDWLTEFEPTWYTAVPTMHQAILARAGDRPRSTSLRFIRSSSASLPPQVMAELERVFSVPVTEAYGMTEAAHQMASNPLPPGKRKPGSVGRAAGPEIAIMDEGRLAASGITGEIVIRGPNVMCGYVANAEANQSAFRSGWLRTGDLGWLDDENYLFISGRTKEIINRGGEKISPREIDEALLEHPAVAQALAFALPDTKLGEEPAAAVVLKPGIVASEAELREFVSGRLADFKVPRRIVLLEEIPKGPTGKPRRIGLAALLGLDGPGLGLDGPRQPAQAHAERGKPRTQSEKLVAGLWQQVLGREDVSAQDNFFDLGGDSMLATQFLSRLAQAGGAAPPLLRLFEQPTVEALAAWLDVNGAPTVALPLVRNPSALAPLSFAQQRFWFLDQYEQGSAAYVQSSAVRLRGRLDTDRLRKALNHIVVRHEILRTTYDVRDGAPIAVLGPPREVELKALTAGSLDAVSDLAAAEVRLPFHLARDLMIHPALARLAPDDHVLLLTRHHIASDGWSAEVLLRDLATLYEGGALQDLPVQYSDYARWQTERFASGLFEEELAYWKERLAGSASLLSLPLDRPRAPRQTFRGARESFVLPPALTQALNELARREGATLFMALLAAFQALLHRYSGADDVAVGCPVAGRGRVELEPLVGLFMNTLVLRSDVSGDPTFRSLLSRVRDTALGAFAHRELPFDKLVEALHPARSLSHSPLFQVLFQLRNLPFAAPRFADLECQPLDVDNGVAQFDLSLEIVPAGGPLHCSLTYNADLFDRETALRIARHYRNLLAAAVEDPERPVSSIPILDEDERRQLLSGWNQTEKPLPAECVHALFEAQAARRPDAIAVLDQNGEFSYSDLNRAADALAHRLRLRGVGPGTLTAVCVERSRGMVVALLGILKAGSAYLPLDPLYPKERLAFMIEDSGAAVLVTEGGVVSHLPERLPPVLLLDSNDAPSSAFQPPVTDLASTAYAIYTSGSSGAPKAVLVPHLAFANILEALRTKFDFGEQDVVVAVTTLSFDIAAVEIFLPLICGGRVAIAGRRQQVDGRALGELIERVNPTWFQATPATWRMLLDAGWSGSKTLTGICGGETMPRPLADALLERCARVFNIYGPTETTIWSTIERVRPGNGTVPIGRPLANTRVYILDNHLEPAPPGVAGELYIAGEGVAQGYWRRPELTAERFLPDPFASAPGARMYKTGDTARWLPGGTVEYLGRYDDQVKLRGFRIELGEVEAALAAHPGVRAAAVSMRDGALIAWCVWRAEAVETSVFRKFLATRLPDYMVPARFAGLASLPSLPNGKVDRRALAGLAEPPQPARVGSAPTDETERRLAAIWEELLGRGPVGLFDDFFELGGHSLLAARTAARIDQAFGTRLPVAALFEAPTVAMLAEHLRRGAQPAWPPRIIPIQPAGTRIPFWAVGGGATFRAVAQHLGLDQPVLGVLLEDSDVATLGPPYSVETISSQIVRLIRQQQPAGPYQLGGHSLYGLFALEAARQLVALGEEVRLLAIFDTYLPSAVRIRFPLDLRVRVQAAAAWWLLSRGRLFDAGSFVLSTAKDLAARFWHAHQPSRQAPRTLKHAPQPLAQAQQPPVHARQPLPRAQEPSSIEGVLRLAAAGYEPRPYPRRIVFLQAADQPIALHLGSRLGITPTCSNGRTPPRWRKSLPVCLLATVCRVRRSHRGIESFSRLGSRAAELSALRICLLRCVSTSKSHRRDIRECATGRLRVSCGLSRRSAMGSHHTSAYGSGGTRPGTADLFRTLGSHQLDQPSSRCRRAADWRSGSPGNPERPNLCHRNACDQLPMGVRSSRFGSYRG